MDDLERNRKLQESILNIDMTCRSMYLSYQDCENLKIPKDSTVYGDMVRYSYIQLCTILDEIKILNRLAKNNHYLQQTLYIISPAVKAIEKFSGIRKARNNMLAHFNRDKKGNFHPWWIALKNVKLPRTQKEINQIYLWLHLINGILVTRYYANLKDLSQKIRKDFNSYHSWMLAQEQEAISNPTPLDNIEVEVEKRMKETGTTRIIIDPIMTKIIDILKNKRNFK